MNKISDNVILMGNGYFNFYLIGKQEAALVECGTTAGALIFAKQWEEMEHKPDVKYIIALHSHFDHACGIPTLKKLFPEAQIVASKIAQKILAKERIVKNLFEGDSFVSRQYYKSGLLDSLPENPNVSAISVDTVVGEGDVLELGGNLKLKIIDAPGHSVCSIAVYVEPDQVMLISDAAGSRLSDGNMSPVFFYDYDLYMSTIKKLMSYPTRLIGTAHGPNPEGKDVEIFYSDALKTAEYTFQLIEEQLKTGVDEDKLARELYKSFIKDGLSYFPEDMMTASMSLLIENVKKLRP